MSASTVAFIGICFPHTLNVSSAVSGHEVQASEGLCVIFLLSGGVGAYPEHEDLMIRLDVCALREVALRTAPRRDGCVCCATPPQQRGVCRTWTARAALAAWWTSS